MMGIYEIRCTGNNKVYVGSAKNIHKRWGIHLHHLRKGTHHSAYLQKSFNKYGEQSVLVSTIELVEHEANLLDREQFWIDTLDSYRNGFNCCPFARSSLGFKMSDESKKLMRTIAVSHDRTGERNPFYGKTHSDETKQKLSQQRRGTTMPDDIKQKISDTCKQNEKLKATQFKPGHTWDEETAERLRQSRIEWYKSNPVSDEERERMRQRMTGENNPMYGKTLTDEHKQKISEAFANGNHPFLGKHHTDNAKQKMSEKARERFANGNHPFTGRTHSEETKRKIGEKAKERAAKRRAIASINNATTT